MLSRRTAAPLRFADAPPYNSFTLKEDQSAGRVHALCGWFLALIATYLAVFVVPFRFPLRQPVLSDVWVAGGNNQVAAIALIAVSIAVTCVLRRRRDGMPTGATGTLQLRHLTAAIGAAVLWITALGAAEARIHVAWGDQAYFLTQLRTGLVLHQALYRGFEFTYGPALYLWPAAFIRALAPVGISPTASYLVSLAVLQALGLCLLFYTVLSLPLSRSLKTTAFLLVSAGAFTALLGLNYTIFRFVLPFAAMVLLARQTTIARALAAAGMAEVATLAVSPELGIAFAAASMVYAVYSAILLGVRWLAIVAGAMLGALLCAAVVGRDYFLTIGRMAHGGYNVLILPSPHILIYLIAIMVLAPITVARALRRRDQSSGMILGIYVLALCLAPAALGRCDPIHIFFDGIGTWLLAFLALNGTSTRTRVLSIATVVCVFALMQARNVGLYRHRVAELRGEIRIDPLEGIDEPKLFAAIGDARVSAPLLAPAAILDNLKRRNQYMPGFYCGWIGVWDSNAEKRVIADMRRAPFALLPLTDASPPSPDDQRRIVLATQLGFAHHAPNELYARGALLTAELNTNWKPIGIYGGYILFRRIPG
jgi:hypothetical protein